MLARLNELEEQQAVEEEEDSGRGSKDRRKASKKR
jgi:hypothetical protein